MASGEPDDRPRPDDEPSPGGDAVPPEAPAAGVVDDEREDPPEPSEPG